MEFNWGQLFVDFSQGLVNVALEMNKELVDLVQRANCETNCGKTLAKATQLDADMNKILDFIENFYKERGLKDVKTMGK